MKFDRLFQKDIEDEQNYDTVFCDEDALIEAVDPDKFYYEDGTEKQFYEDEFEEDHFVPKKYRDKDSDEDENSNRELEKHDECGGKCNSSTNAYCDKECGDNTVDPLPPRQRSTSDLDNEFSSSYYVPLDTMNSGDYNEPSEDYDSEEETAIIDNIFKSFLEDDKDIIDDEEDDKIVDSVKSEYDKKDDDYADVDSFVKPEEDPRNVIMTKPKELKVDQDADKSSIKFESGADLDAFFNSDNFGIGDNDGLGDNDGIGYNHGLELENGDDDPCNEEEIIDDEDVESII